MSVNEQRESLPHQADFDSARTTAMATGDLGLAAREEAVRVLAEHKRHPLEATKAGINRLLGEGVISEHESQALTSICEEIFAAVRGKKKSNDVEAIIRATYGRMAADRKASPVARRSARQSVQLWGS